MSHPNSNELMRRALESGTVIPAINIPFLPVIAPVVDALRDTETFGFIAVARLEWIKFEARSPRAIFEEYQRRKDERFTRLHLDHVPVIDEDDLRVDYLADIGEAVDLGYDSVMIDGSRLPFDENVDAVKQVVALAHAKNVPVEAELGAILGHEKGPLPPYEELFASGKGFTDVDEAKRFVDATDVDWLSVAIGNIHGAISGAAKDEKKPETRINIQRLDDIRSAIDRPIVLHGGSGIKKSYILDGIKHGIAKINIASTVRQAYEQNKDESVAKAQKAVYDTMVDLIRNELEIAGSAKVLNASAN